jgi:hypothetical protein
MSIGDIEVLGRIYRRISNLEKQVVVVKEPLYTPVGGFIGALITVPAVELPIATAIQLLADAIGMEFQTEAAMPSKTVLVKKTEENV